MRQQTEGFFPNQRFRAKFLLLSAAVEPSSSSHTDPCCAKGEKQLLFSTLFLCVIRDGPRRQGFPGEYLRFDRLSEL